MDNSEISKKYDLENESFENYIQYLREHALAQRSNFLNVEPFSLSTAVWAVNYMQIYYINNIFFPDEEIYSKFNDFGIKKSDLKWMMPIEELKEHFDNLTYKGVLIYRHEFMRHLMIHLLVYTAKDVISWAELYRPTRKGSITLGSTTQIKHAIDRVRSGSKRQYNPSEEKEIANALAEIVIQTENDANMKPNTIISMLNGNLKKEFLFNWLKYSFPYSQNTLTQDEFLREILPLLKYVFRNLTIPESMEDIPDGKYARRKIDKVQLKIIKKWLLKE